MPKFESYAQGTPNWIEVMSPDQKATRDFYAGLFGWEIEESPIDDQGNVYMIGKLEGDQIAGIGGHMPELAGHPAFWNVYLAADDVDASAAKVVEAGGKVEAGPFDVMEHGRMVAIQDPTGARVSLWQAKAHIGTGRANEPGTPIWNELVTPDVERATQFYGDVLGMGVEKMEMPDGVYTGLTVDGRMIGGAMEPQMEGMPPHWNVYFNVASVDDSVAKAEGFGAQVMAPAFDVNGVGRMAFLADPQGGMFALMQSASDGG
jgi:predicted enzyme related to lactoylglutathione lyase